MINRYYTNSELGTFRDCPRRWYIQHYLKRARKREYLNENTEIGNGVHFAVAEHYNSGLQSDIVADVVLYFARLREEQALGENPSDGEIAIVEANLETIDKAEAYAKIMVEGYVQWLEEEGEDSYLQFISAEEEVAVEFPSDGLPKDGIEKPFLLAKLDARFIDERTGARVFMDHKSVQNFVEREKWAHLDPQFLFYSLIDYLQNLADAASPDEVPWTDGGIINMLRRVKRTARSTPPFYKRFIVRHSIIELRNYYVRVAGEIARIQDTELKLDAGLQHQLVAPPHPSRDCDWKCPYMQLCAMMDDGSDVDGYMETALVIRDPLARYEEYSG